MRSKLLRSEAIGLYILFAIFVLVGLAMSPLFTSASGSFSASSSQSMWTALPTDTFEASRRQVSLTFIVSVSVFPSEQVKTMTPVSTIVVVAALGSGNLSSLLRISSGTLKIDNAALPNGSSFENTLSLPLNSSVNEKGDWSGSTSATIEYLRRGSWTGSLSYTVLLSDGTSLTRELPVSIPDLQVFGSNDMLRISYWLDSIFVWVIGLVVFLVGIYFIKKPVRKTFRRRD